jgi:hypothetical protein
MKRKRNFRFISQQSDQGQSTFNCLETSHQIYRMARNSCLTTGTRSFDNGFVAPAFEMAAPTHPEFRYRLRKRRIFSLFQPIERQGPDGTSLHKNVALMKTDSSGLRFWGRLVEIRMESKVTMLSRLFPVDSALLRKEKEGRRRHSSAVV